LTPAPEAVARLQIDSLLIAVGWLVQDVKAANIHAGRGVALREFPLAAGYGFADYLLYVDGRAAGVIEAKKVGVTLTGVEIQSDRYSKGLPAGLPAWYQPLPFSYQSTGIETRFTNGLDPEPRSRPVFSFHRPETLADWLEECRGEPACSPAFGPRFTSGQTHGSAPTELLIAADPAAVYNRPSTLRARLQQLPPLITTDLWPAQIKAITRLEKSLAENRPRALIQMATGSGKTFTAVNSIYRLIKFGGARRVLFLVDRANLGRQTYKEFQQFDSPHSPHKFTQEFIVQHLQGPAIDPTARVCICTIQRLYSILKGEELAPDLDEVSGEGLASLFKEAAPVAYNPLLPPESFDVIVTDECHRSIYNLWRQVLEYFDSFLIGLTATPSKQTFGFFNQNLVMEYPHEQAVADGVNVNYDVYRIRNKITEGGSIVEAGHFVDLRDRETRSKRWERLDENLSYDPNQLDREVVSVDQIRKVIQTFRDRLFTEIFPGRTEVPKTLIFAKDDSHADDIVQIVREEFGKGNDFAQKITYKTTGAKPEDLISAFRNSYFPRIVVSVDMIATGTDIKPLEIVMFMRSVQSRAFFDQMKGRGVRIIDRDTLQQVTPDAEAKTHFVIVDAVGVCERDKTDSRPLEKKPSYSLEKLLQAVALGNTESEVISSIAGRLARLEKKLSAPQQEQVKKLMEGKSLKVLTGELILAIDPDAHLERARQQTGNVEPTPAQVRQAAAQIIGAAVRPLTNPVLRQTLVDLHKTTEQTIDTVSSDELISAGFDADALEKAQGLVASFEEFIATHKDEITALQLLYNLPYAARLRYEDIKELAEALHRPPHLYSESQLWQAYAALDAGKVKGAGGKRILTDLVSLVRFAMHQENELVPYPEKVQVNFAAWLGQQQASGRYFSDEQRQWLEMIRDYIASNLQIEREDFEYAPFAQEGGIGKVWQLFGEDLNRMLDELNGALVA
jgi:type I restriction enzyme R subunit